MQAAKMDLPPTNAAHPAAWTMASDSKPKVVGWSTLVGIVCALCGNVLISFALNTQRYAHIRLSRNRQEVEEKQRASERRRQRRQGQGRSYGTQQVDVAEERARINMKGEPNDDAGYSLGAEGGSPEADPLIPHVGSTHSDDDTLKADEKGDEAPEQKSYLKSPIWWLGIALMVVGEAGNFLAYGFAPASIVSPLGVVALVSNCMIAPLLLGERFRIRDGIGVIIAIAGCVTVVLSASSSNPKLDQNKIWYLISQWEFETYFGVTVFLIVVLMVASNKFGHRTILIDLGLVGLFGGYTALSTKGIASLLSSKIWRVITFPITYLLLAVLIFTAVMQIKYVNRALQHFNATMVIPTQFVLFTLSVIIGSAILYRDFEREAPGDAAKFVGGCALTFLGVWCITSGRGDENEGDEEYGEEDDAIKLLDEENVQPEIREREDETGRKATSSTAEQLLRRQVAGMSSMPSSSNPYAAPPTSSSQEYLQPATAAAIHSQSMSELPTDESAVRDPKKPPPMHATTSAPLIPTTDTISPLRPKTPLNRNATGPASPARASPTRQQSNGQLLDPNNPPRLLSRHSVAGLLPGPLISPLSGSLSAIVADSLRRGVDSPVSTFRRRSSQGRRRLGVGQGNRRPNAAALKRHSIGSGQMDFDEDDAEVVQGSGSVRDPQGRVRSLSATLGDLFGSQKRQRLESQESVQEYDEEEDVGGPK